MTAEIIPLDPPKAEELRCIFCRHTMDSNHRMLTSTITKQSICHHCARKAGERLKQAREAQQQ